LPNVAPKSRSCQKVAKKLVWLRLLVEAGEILLMESTILGFGIQNTAQGITIRIQNPRFTDKNWNPVLGIQILANPCMGRNAFLTRRSWGRES